MSPEQRQQRIGYKRRVREQLRGEGLTSRGTAPMNACGAVGRGSQETVEMRRAIRRSGRLPSVARLVWMAQRDYWREHPDEHAEYSRAQRTRYHHWRYLMDPEYRIYHRQKSKRRKALERGSIGVHVKAGQIRARFAEFDYSCAYCGARGDLHIEHLVPIARGGTHVLGNILPACQRCNFSKAAKDAEPWYRAHPWFSEVRWRKIRRVLGIGSGHAAQLALL
jgi:5-methylcytosine-specific restriction endonuclease McrA